MGGGPSTNELISTADAGSMVSPSEEVRVGTAAAFDCQNWVRLSKRPGQNVGILFISLASRRNNRFAQTPSPEEERFRRHGGG